MITGKFKISRGATDWTCVPDWHWGPLAFQHDVCPALSLPYDQASKTIIKDLCVVTDFTAGAWNDAFGIFIATSEMKSADSMFAWFAKFHHLTDIAADDFSIQPESGVGCSLNILHNADFDYGDPRSWYPFFDMNIEMHPCADSSGKSNMAGACVGSKYWHEGVGQKMDRSCLDTETEFYTEVDVMLFEEDKTTPYACDEC